MARSILIVSEPTGYTLVELLVVVAITGILVVAAVPSYQKMVAAAKQSEAKAELGDLAHLENGFFAEQNSYGDNLAVMGYQQELAATASNYVVGFPAGDCSDLVTLNPPNNGSPVPSQINQWNCAYYEQAGCKIPVNPLSNATNVTVFGKVLSSLVPPGQSSPVTVSGFTSCSTSTNGVTNDVGSIGLDGGAKSYQAAAFGCIRAGVDPTDCSGIANADVWVIDQTNKLSNAQDGRL